MPTITQRLKRVLSEAETMTQRVVDSLLKTLREIEVEKAKRTAELDEAADQIKAQLAELGHPVGETNGRHRKAGRNGKAVKAKRTKSRGRRSGEEMKAEAERMVKFIKGKGGEGASGAEIK